MKPVTSLILLADDRRARLLENRGVGKGFKELAVFDADTLEGADVRYSDRPGRSQSATGAATHGVDPSTSEETQERDFFARYVADKAEKTFSAGGYDRFAMAAAPKMLGMLREQISKPLEQALAFDVAKDLVGIATDNLAKHLEDYGAF